MGNDGKPVIRSKWRERTGTASDSTLLRGEEERIREAVTREFSQHSRALRDGINTHLVDFKDK